MLNYKIGIVVDVDGACLMRKEEGFVLDSCKTPFPVRSDLRHVTIRTMVIFTTRVKTRLVGQVFKEALVCFSPVAPLLHQTGCFSSPKFIAIEATSLSRRCLTVCLTTWYCNTHRGILFKNVLAKASFCRPKTDLAGSKSFSLGGMEQL